MWMGNIMLENICRINTNIGEDTFVGIKNQEGKFTITFPVGYRLGKNDNELRSDILLLLKTLKNNIEHKESDKFSAVDEGAVCDFPISSYIYLMEDYMINGYYKEFQSKFCIGRSGKISWNKTIKQITPMIQDDNAVYDKFVVRKNITNEEEFITYIHQFCVYRSFKMFGWIYGTFVPQKPKLKFNKEVFLRAITKKEQSTFNDKHKMLFHHMKQIIDDTSKSSISNVGAKYGTNRFEYVWEKLIDKIFGITNKKDYFPSTYWNLWDLNGKSKCVEKAKLEPDSIMITDESIYVLDAKYYKYGQTRNVYDLPDTSSISKQIIYGEHIYNHNPGKNVYNAFLLPFDSYLWGTDEFHLLGVAYSEWKDGTKDYELIKGVLADTKYIMEIAEKADKESYRLYLSKMIEIEK